MAIPDEAAALHVNGMPERGSYVVHLLNNERVRARSVIIATGARYRRLDVADLERFEGSCVHYWASPLEMKLCIGHDIALVGAGNSAGQAVVYLAGRAATVRLLVRGRDLASSMSRCLVDRIESLSNGEIITQAQIIGLEGEQNHLEAVRWRLASGEEVRHPIRHLFLFIGASPNTQWLASSGVALDSKGFIVTGSDASPGRHPLETNLPGVFAIGDVRSGSVKRVAAAVGEGAQVLAAVYSFLAKASTTNAVLTAARAWTKSKHHGGSPSLIMMSNPTTRGDRGIRRFIDQEIGLMVSKRRSPGDPGQPWQRTGASLP